MAHPRRQRDEVGVRGCSRGGRRRAGIVEPQQDGAAGGAAHGCGEISGRGRSLAHVVGRPELHGGDGDLLRARAGHHDDGYLGARGPEAPQHVEAPAVRQIELGDDAADPPTLECRQRGAETGDGGHPGVVLDGQDGLPDPGRFTSVGIDHQDVKSRQRRQTVHPLLPPYAIVRAMVAMVTR